MLSNRIVLVIIVALMSCAPIPRNSANIQSANPSLKIPTGYKSSPAIPILIRKKNGHYRVAQPWTVDLAGRRWTVQKGYTCNGLTAPSQLKASLGDRANAPETWSAVFHDWLFTQPGISRSEADQLFYEMLIAYGVNAQKARMMYTFVAAYSVSKQIH
jgi:hypothetical protein